MGNLEWFEATVLWGLTCTEEKATLRKPTLISLSLSGNFFSKSRARK